MNDVTEIVILLAVLVAVMVAFLIAVVSLLFDIKLNIEHTHKKIDSVYDLIFDIKKEVFKKPKTNNPQGVKPENIEQSCLIHGRCPECGALVYPDECACRKCGQKLDWSDIEFFEQGRKELEKLGIVKLHR